MKNKYTRITGFREHFERWTESIRKYHYESFREYPDDRRLWQVANLLVNAENRGVVVSFELGQFILLIRFHEHNVFHVTGHVDIEPTRLERLFERIDEPEKVVLEYRKEIAERDPDTIPPELTIKNDPSFPPIATPEQVGLFGHVVTELINFGACKYYDGKFAYLERYFSSLHAVNESNRLAQTALQIQLEGLKEKWPNLSTVRLTDMNYQDDQGGKIIRL